MAESDESATKANKRGISGATSIFAVWCLFAAINQTTVFASVSPQITIETQLLLHLYDVGYFLTLGLLSAGVCGAFRKWAPDRTKLATFALFLGSLGISCLVIPPDLSNLSVRLAENRGPWVTTAVIIGGVAAFSLLAPIGFLLGRLLARPYWRWIGVAIGVAVFCAHPHYLVEFYHGIHLFIAIFGAILFAASLAGAEIPDVVSQRFSFQAPKLLRSISLALLTAIAAYAIGRRPPAKVSAELVRFDFFLLPHFLSRLLHAPTPLRKEPIPAEMADWFVNREKHSPIAPTLPKLLTDKPIVILITIDCLRSDLVMSGNYDAQLPGLANLRNGSIAFADARSTAPGTISSLASIFTSTYFSQQYWVPAGAWKKPFPDDHVRFTEILTKSGISTITFTSAQGLLPSFGLMRGFSETTDMRQANGKYGTAESMTNAAMKRLRRAPSESVFLHLHFLEAHHPYDLGIQTGSQFDRYLSELAIVDRQIERWRQFLFADDFASRSVLFISADHGEAFGEHGTIHHSSTIYDELLRVPLLVWQPRKSGQIPKEPVSLIDLGPTILDLFGLPTPGHFMGQSLVPFLRGENPKLTRPILAEARLKQTLVLPDGHKVIVDNRLNTVELYDLKNDPGELTSLAEDDEMLSRPLSLLRQFFEAHRNRTPGYTPPYRVW